MEATMKDDQLSALKIDLRALKALFKIRNIEFGHDQECVESKSSGCSIS